MKAKEKNLRKNEKWNPREPLIQTGKPVRVYCDVNANFCIQIDGARIYLSKFKELDLAIDDIASEISDRYIENFESDEIEFGDLNEQERKMLLQKLKELELDDSGSILEENYRE